jgi:hypothetical protein
VSLLRVPKHIILVGHNCWPVSQLMFDPFRASLTYLLAQSRCGFFLLYTTYYTIFSIKSQPFFSFISKNLTSFLTYIRKYRRKRIKSQPFFSFISKNLTSFLNLLYDYSTICTKSQPFFPFILRKNSHKKALKECVFCWNVLTRIRDKKCTVTLKTGLRVPLTPPNVYFILLFLACLLP